MKPDYDLSDLETSQADLWLFLRVDAIYAQIVADQAERWASTGSWAARAVLAATPCKDAPETACGYSPTACPGELTWEPLQYLFSQSASSRALPDQWSSVRPRIRAALKWVH